RSVSAAAVNSDVKHECARHSRPRVDGNFPGRNIRFQMDAPYAVCTDFKNSRQYPDDTPSVFLPLFKSKYHASGYQVFIFRKDFGCAEQHGGMAVMAAHMCGSVILRNDRLLTFKVVFIFSHRECVQITS